MLHETHSVKEFGGYLHRFQHASDACQCTMTFSVYLPAQAQAAPLPAVYWLSGLTCTDENFRTKAGAQRYAADLGLVLVIPDTSPRGEGVADEPERYDLGQGAGFYVDATEAPWAPHYRMYDYVTRELPALVEQHLPVRAGVRSISGHSMGGHGALIAALKNPDAYRSVSAFAPICNPSRVPWGEGCFGAYLGADRSRWEAYDAVALLEDGASMPPLLVDQGGADEFLDSQLRPERLRDVLHAAGAPGEVRTQGGYDHSYHFIATFIGEHLAFHARHLRRG